jgi:peptide-methionine (S)-S-oxide reductase
MKVLAVFGGGCFWCTEAVFRALKGIASVTPGYSGGTVEHPTYEQVSTGATGHAEATKIEFDSDQISYEDLLTVFFVTHNPTTPNRQGNDVGTQYRSIIFYTTHEQRDEAEEFIEKLKAEVIPIVTEVQPFVAFFEAEDYHQKYYENHKDQPYCQIVIEPKLQKLREHFRELLK